MLNEILNRLRTIIGWIDREHFTLLLAALATLFTGLMVIWLLTLTGCDDVYACCKSRTCGDFFDYSVCPTQLVPYPVPFPVPTEETPTADAGGNSDAGELDDAGGEQCGSGTPPVPPVCEEHCLTPFGKCVSDCVKTHGANKYGRCVFKCRKEQA